MTNNVEKNFHLRIEDLTRLTLRIENQIAKEKVFYVRNGKQCMRDYVIPTDPKTKLQQAIRRKFRNAVKSWQQLTNEQKQYWENLVKQKGLSMEGFNLYISYFMRDLI